MQEFAVTLQGNDKMPLYFDMPSNDIINDIGAKSLIIKLSSNGKL
jgi:hypothetical protein